MIGILNSNSADVMRLQEIDRIRSNNLLTLNRFYRIVGGRKTVGRAKLLPCPFCNSNDAIVIDLNIAASRVEYIVVCQKCSGQTGYFSLRKKAVAAWNRRPSK